MVKVATYLMRLLLLYIATSFIKRCHCNLVRNISITIVIFRNERSTIMDCLQYGLVPHEFTSLLQHHHYKPYGLTAIFSTFLMANWFIEIIEIA